MSAVPTPRAAPVRIALLGTGTVGTAFRERLHAWRHEPRTPLALVAEANTRTCRVHGAATAARAPVAVGFAERAVHALGSGGTRIVVDATASDALAECHAGWLERGLHVVTASKLGQGGPWSRWEAIVSARTSAGTRYGDSATVGAGLPLLRSLRDLRAAGERIHAIAGVLSGSLAWLLARHDGSRPFADWVGEAHARGYTEPDPDQDLSGEDVRRKLLILARAAGHALACEIVQVEPLLPAAMAARLEEARIAGGRLAYVARLQCDGDRLLARAGLECLAPGDPLAQGGETDNRVAIWCDRYRERPLLIQGPGAGAGVTAAALLDDVLAIARGAALTS